MGEKDEQSVMGDCDGAIGPQSDEEPIFHELRVEDEIVQLVGPSPGQLREFDINEFESLVTQGEWVLTDYDSEEVSTTTK